jgi:hypothetical protein
MWSYVSFALALLACIVSVLVLSVIVFCLPKPREFFNSRRVFNRRTGRGLSNRHIKLPIGDALDGNITAGCL